MPRNPKRKLSHSPIRPSKSIKPSSDPFPDFPHPTPEQCLAVRDALFSLHGLPEEFSRYQRASEKGLSPAIQPPATAAEEAGGGVLGIFGETVLDGLISTLLSQNTTDSNSRRAFESLKSAFPTWEQLLEDTIRCGGLAPTKAARIKGILEAVREKRGEICLEYLRGLSVDEVKAELSQFKGIGPKTVACVLMFNLQLDDFPVDTHVHRITKSMGWVPVKADREKAYLHLNKRIPNDLKFDLNCLLVTHGKLCQRCAKKGGNQQRGVAHSSCPLTGHFCNAEQKC